jgi:uncharacterized membrane protein YedE/YeeE
MGRLWTFISGLLFGTGVTVSGMVNPMKVLNFMDLSGQWDASLIFVMGAGLIVTMIGYQLIFRRNAPVFATSFKLPTQTRIDARLVAGAALFGLGWGLSGFCPGPAVASLVFGKSESFVFVAAMAVAMIATRQIQDVAQQVRPNG